MVLALLSVDKYLLATSLANLGSLTALVLDVELEIFFFQSKATPLRALDQSVTAASSFMFHRWLVRADIAATVMEAFEFEIEEISRNEPVHLSELNCFVALALLWARVVLFSPRSNAVGTEHRLASRAFHWFHNHHGANRTDEEVRPVSLLLVFLHKLSDVQVL